MLSGLNRSHSAVSLVSDRYACLGFGEQQLAAAPFSMPRAPRASVHGYIAEGASARQAPAVSQLSARSRRLSEPALLHLGAVAGRQTSVAGATVAPAANGAAEASAEAAVGEPPTSRPGVVRVVARIRPPLSVEEKVDAGRFVADVASSTIVSPEHVFQFDGVFDQDSTQECVYENVGKRTVADVLDGYNGTILAYGATGSGKTHCMFGPPEASEQLAGIVPRATRKIFAGLAATPASASAVVECSFLEVYCEQLRDLLQKGRSNLQVKETPKHGVFVDGLQRRQVKSVGEALQALRYGIRLRSSANNSLNQHSSRSHAIFTLHIMQQVAGGVCNSKLTLVDLAGSEKLQKKGGASAPQIEECKKINSSLSALGSVIGALADQRPHVPYRDAKLTRVLGDSLGGNCGTTLLVALSPSKSQAAESLSSVRFAMRARKVRTNMRVNTTPVAVPAATGAPQAALMQRIAKLERDLAEAHQVLESRTRGQASLSGPGNRCREPLETPILKQNTIAKGCRASSASPRTRGMKAGVWSSESGAMSQSTASLGRASCLTSLTSSSAWRHHDDEDLKQPFRNGDFASIGDQTARYEQELTHVRLRRDALLRELDIRRHESQELQRQLSDSQMTAIHLRQRMSEVGITGHAHAGVVDSVRSSSPQFCQAPMATVAWLPGLRSLTPQTERPNAVVGSSVALTPRRSLPGVHSALRFDSRSGPSAATITRQAPPVVLSGHSVIPPPPPAFAATVAIGRHTIPASGAVIVWQGKDAAGLSLETETPTPDSPQSDVCSSGMSSGAATPRSEGTQL